MSKNVVMVKTVAGEYYIGYEKPHNGTEYVELEDARSLTMQATPRGAALACIPLVPFAIKSPDTVKISSNNILHVIEEDNINDQIVKGYKSEVSGLDLATTPQIVTP